MDRPRHPWAAYQDARTHLADGSWTMQQAAFFLGSASDKTQPITVDEVIYLNDILGINNGTTGYINLTGFNYDRSSVYADQPVTYLKDNGDGTYSTVTSTVMDAVFSGTNYTDSGADAFAQAADDVRAVINFVHEPIH